LPAVGVDRVDKRLKIALDCGADHVINSGNDNWQDILGEKPNAIIESTGAPEAVNMALQTVNTFGRVILLGSTRGDSTVNFYSDVHRNGVMIIGAHAARTVPKYESSPGYWTWRDEACCFMNLLKRKKINLEPLITNRTKWENIEDAYKEILAWNTDMIGTIINWV
jgi:L-iditol 2-dehydrogenase